MLFSSQAWAQSTPVAATGPSMVEQMLPLVLIFVVFYFLFLRPQAKSRKEHAQVLEKLKRGDSVITYSGIFGRLDTIEEKFVTLEVAHNVKIKMLKSQVAGLSKEKA